MNNMEKFKITAKEREVFGKKMHALKATGLIPAVLYGGGNKKSVPLFVQEKEFISVFRQAGESSLITLDLGNKNARQVLVHEIVRHPVSDKFVHIDFFEVRMDEKIKTKVPLSFVGESLAVKADGANLVRALRELEIECFPKDLPHEIEVDISQLEKIGDMLRIKDLKLPSGVEVHADADEVVALTEAPRSEEELTNLAKPVEEQEGVAQVKVVGEEERAAKAAEEGSKAEESGKAKAEK
jgi:large subunit ribosomal protein L25